MHNMTNPKCPKCGTKAKRFWNGARCSKCGYQNRAGKHQTEFVPASRLYGKRAIRL